MSRFDETIITALTHYFSTIRHLTASQIWHRSHRIIRRRWWRMTAKRSPLSANGQLTPHTPLYLGLADISNANGSPDEIAAAIGLARSYAENKFCFLSRTVSFGERIGWHDANQSQLWRYQLHSFDYVRDLLIWAAAGDSDNAYRAFRRLALSWIDGNQALSGDGWHPYTISLRVVNWLNALSFFSKEMNADVENSIQIVRSTYGQLQVLFSDLELDVRGNHLLENLRALICAGLAFEGSEPQSWFERAMQLLEQEVAEQVLSDGGHFERSPGYHLVVFKDLLEIALALQRNRGDVPSWLDDALRRMTVYCLSILAPDGNVPLLKDSVWNNWPSVQELLAASAVYFNEPSYKIDERFGLYSQLVFGREGEEKFHKWPINTCQRTSLPLPASAHYVIRDDEAGDYLILDAGKTCPDYLPAHAHADSLTYELTIAGQRIVVDSGVYEYKTGSWRDYFRSTRAHSTVEVSGENQSEVWASFRVGRRARPGPVYWQAGDDFVLAQGEHDGYRRLSVSVIHQRTVFYRKEEFWLVADQLWGNGEAAVDNHVHLNPELSLEMTDASTWRILNSRAPLWLTAFGEKGHSIVSGQTEPFRQGWYSERFGELRSNFVLTLHQRTSLPFCLGYIIAHDVPLDVQVTPLTGGHEIRFIFRSRTHTLRLVRTEAPRIA
jgi:uncharacterized heparinase superfamily protein